MNTAILFDTMSIQQYVFGSNKLKDNLGASYIVEHIYDYLERKTKLPNPDLTKGYIGGGNALFFTSSEMKAKEIVKEFTTDILYNFPGVSLAVAIKENFKTDEYPKEIKILFQKLTDNKGFYLPVNTISSHGITDTCKYSSLSVEHIIEFNENGIKSFELASSLTMTKRNFKEGIENDGKKILEEVNFQFTDLIDKLGQKKSEDSHIAVVHIDGNGFGKHFINSSTLIKSKELSEQVIEAVKKAFTHSIVCYSQIEEKVKHLIEPYNYDNNILPIRPIILGGDDVTFVCHGKLGIWFAEKFMESFRNNTFTDNDGKEQKFSSCAGVAIVKNKYPFYRAYQLAEELCGSAKSARKKYMDDNQIEDGGNWIDFQLAYSGLGNTLEEVRKLQYLNVKGIAPLHNRPYCLDEMAGQISVNQLKGYTATLNKTLPNSKIKDLREMLTRDDDSQNVFIEHLKLQHNEKDGFKDQICKNNSAEEILLKYPFFDMIELLELYPTNLLNEN
jgi:hypothetical protein